ncbi:hypothetical protein GCM10009730_45560 [Streptomyces albidochromogenes]|uniref:hypothetical protein n=1 Tax=Streptomyces albidochromogenes TaxID=329524 RepID=UPI00110F7BDE|nr:hypothetical protein [Streptomyces albidochromogenes]
MNQAPGGAVPVGVIVSLAPDRYRRTVEAARRIGLVVTGEQPVLGSLSGTIAEDRIPALQAVEGVESVDRARTVQLPPPDSPIQ